LKGLFRVHSIRIVIAVYCSGIKTCMKIPGPIGIGT
jgi:hypothetical protein